MRASRTRARVVEACASGCDAVVTRAFIHFFGILRRRGFRRARTARGREEMKCIRMMSVCGATCEVQIRIIRARSSMGVVAMRESNRIESNRIESNRITRRPGLRVPRRRARRRTVASRIPSKTRCPPVSDARPDDLSGTFD